MYAEDDLIPISALQHYVFCPRQCALIHVEQVWAENRFTVEGSHMHEKVHSELSEKKKEIRVEYGMSVQSLRLGLIGKTDVVEFHYCSQKSTVLKEVIPVEYKRGKPKDHLADDIQLCAQALCLEEMLDVSINKGALFYGKTRRRKQVDFDEVLRGKTKVTAESIHELINSGKTPRPVWNQKCAHCSLQELCLPKTIAKKRSVKHYLQQVLHES